MSRSPVAYAITCGNGTHAAVSTGLGTPGDALRMDEVQNAIKDEDARGPDSGMIVASVCEACGERLLISVASNANAPIANVAWRAARAQLSGAAGRAIAAGRSINSTNNPNMTARPIDDHRMYRRATKLTAAARWATPTKYAMNTRAGSHFGTSTARLVAAVKCSPANAASAAATKAGPSTTRPKASPGATVLMSRR